MAISNLFLGLDVHKDSITAAVFVDRASEPERVDRLANDLHKLKRYFDRLAKRGTVQACYEASGAGYVLQRHMTAWGYQCDLAAPSLIPTRPGDRRKHDKRDAIQLGRLYRSGELTLIHIPTEAEEQVRDVVRCRETFQREILKSRHYILKFLRRRGFVFRGGTNWTRSHFVWIRQLLQPGVLSDEDRLVLSEYLALLEYKLSRRDELDRQVERLALEPRYQPLVNRLRCFRGLDTHGAMVLAAEVGDFRRFRSPRQLMAYFGLVPSEHSSGDRQRQGAITKAGNAHCRHVLVQAAWSYRHRPNQSAALARRQQGQDPAVIAHAWKAQHRLYKLFHRIHHRRPHQVAVVATARELVGFLWAVLQEPELYDPPRENAA
jgi:transposase